MGQDAGMQIDLNWRRLLWLPLAAQASAFAVGIALLSMPPPPAEVPNLAPVGTLIYRTLAVLGFGLTVLVGWLLVPPARGFRWVEVAVEAVVLVITAELLNADPHVLGWGLLALAAVVLAALTWRRLAARGPRSRRI